MKKMRLTPDDLRVESFELLPESGSPGTVVAAALAPSFQGTCADTCSPTKCGGNTCTCEATCLNSCPTVVCGCDTFFDTCPTGVCEC